MLYGAELNIYSDHSDDKPRGNVDYFDIMEKITIKEEPELLDAIKKNVMT